MVNFVFLPRWSLWSGGGGGEGGCAGRGGGGEGGCAGRGGGEGGCAGRGGGGILLWWLAGLIRAWDPVWPVWTSPRKAEGGSGLGTGCVDREARAAAAGVRLGTCCGWHAACLVNERHGHRERTVDKDLGEAVPNAADKQMDTTMTPPSSRLTPQV